MFRIGAGVTIVVCIGVLVFLPSNEKHDKEVASEESSEE